MAKLINLNTIEDNRGNITIIDKIIPFNIKRLYYIYNCDSKIRGGHKHIKTKQALICLNGSCNIIINHDYTHPYILDNPKQCLILNPSDYHLMKDFKNNAILLVLASEHYDENDYIYE